MFFKTCGLSWEWSFKTGTHLYVHGSGLGLKFAKTPTAVYSKQVSLAYIEVPVNFQITNLHRFTQTNMTTVKLPF